jgi:hypothetical protein
MKKAIIIALAVASALWSQTTDSNGRTLATVTYANLGTPANGTMYYCSNCTAASPTGSGGTGVVVRYENGQWNGSGGGGGSGTVTSIIAGQCLSGGTITTSGTIALAGGINPQTATYQVLAGDFSACKTITVASGTFTITLVASGSQPPNGQYINVLNYGSGVVTVARSGQNINGGTASLTLAAGSATAPTSATIWSDGTNYFAEVPGSGGGTVTTTEHHYYTPAKCQSGAAGLAFSNPIASAPTPVCDSAAVNGAVFAYAQFTATGQSVQDHFHFPSEQSGAVNMFLRSNAVSTTGNQVWAIQTGCVNDGSIPDPTFNTKQSLTIATAGTTLQLTSGTQTSLTLTGCSPGYEFFWKLTLDAATTTTGNINLLDLDFIVGRTL